MGGTNAQLPIGRQVSLPGFAEFTEVYQIETDFAAKVESEFNKMVTQAANVLNSPRALVKEGSLPYRTKRKGRS